MGNLFSVVSVFKQLLGFLHLECPLFSKVVFFFTNPNELLNFLKALFVLLH
jgi:hypothetical protein